MTDNRSPGPQSPDAFDLLRAADPARHSTPDLAALRREVDRRITAESAAPPGATPRRSATPRWQRLVAVAAGVAVLGGGAFAAGRQTVDARDVPLAAAGGAPASPLSPSAASAPAAPQGPAALPGRPSAGRDSEAASTQMDRSLIGIGRTQFLDGGLPTTAGSGTAWTYRPAEVATAANAERLAAALGVPGPAVDVTGAFVVGPDDGSGPTVSIAQDGSASFAFSDPRVGVDCSATAAEVAPAVPDAPAPPDAPVDSAGGSLPDPGALSPAKPGAAACAPPIGAQDAIDRSSALLRSIGLDPSAFTLTAPDDQFSGGYRSVVGAPLAGGVSIGDAWSFTFVGDQLAFFSGPLAPLASLGEYTLISPAQAVARMNDTRFGAVGGWHPLAGADVAREPGPGGGATTAPAPATPGAPLPWRTTRITVTTATPALMTQYQDDGAVLVLPAYAMADSSGASWTVLAVADEELDFG